MAAVLEALSQLTAVNLKELHHLRSDHTRGWDQLVQLCSQASGISNHKAPRARPDAAGIAAFFPVFDFVVAESLGCWILDVVAEVRALEPNRDRRGRPQQHHARSPSQRRAAHLLGAPQLLPAGQHLCAGRNSAARVTGASWCHKRSSAAGGACAVTSARARAQLLGAGVRRHAADQQRPARGAAAGRHLCARLVPARAGGDGAQPPRGPAGARRRKGCTELHTRPPAA